MRRIARASGFELDVAAEAARGFAELWVSERPGDAAAAYALFWRVADELELLQLATDAAQRRQGAARALLEHVLAGAAPRGFRAIFLEVRAGNAGALGLYQSLGFEPTRVRRRYYADGEDAVEMRRSLD